MQIHIETESDGKLAVTSFAINVNDKVRVQITDEGWRRLKARDGLGSYWDSPQDKAGFSEWELWALMEAFGDQCYNGNPNPPFRNMLIYIKATA